MEAGEGSLGDETMCDLRGIIVQMVPHPKLNYTFYFFLDAVRTFEWQWHWEVLQAAWKLRGPEAEALRAYAPQAHARASGLCTH